MNRISVSLKDLWKDVKVEVMNNQRVIQYKSELLFNIETWGVLNEIDEKQSTTSQFEHHHVFTIRSEEKKKKKQMRVIYTTLYTSEDNTDPYERKQCHFCNRDEKQTEWMVRVLGEIQSNEREEGEEFCIVARKIEIFTPAQFEKRQEFIDNFFEKANNKTKTIENKTERIEQQQQLSTFDNKSHLLTFLQSPTVKFVYKDGITIDEIYKLIGIAKQISRENIELFLLELERSGEIFKSDNDNTRFISM